MSRIDYERVCSTRAAIDGGGRGEARQPEIRPVWAKNSKVSTPLPPVAATWPRPSLLLKTTSTPPVSTAAGSVAGKRVQVVDVQRSA